MVILLVPISLVIPMNRSWNILCWNVRGINPAEKWPLIRNKIDESNCEIFYFQEAKKSHLIQPSSGILLQEDLTNSFMLPRWGLQVDY